MFSAIARGPASPLWGGCPVDAEHRSAMTGLVGVFFSENFLCAYRTSFANSAFACSAKASTIRRPFASPRLARPSVIGR